MKIDIADNGSGFIKDKPQGCGLSNMQKRAVTARGMLSIQSNIHGTTITITLPPAK